MEQCGSFLVGICCGHRAFLRGFLLIFPIKKTFPIKKKLNQKSSNQNFSNQKQLLLCMLLPPLTRRTWHRLPPIHRIN